MEGPKEPKAPVEVADPFSNVFKSLKDVNVSVKVENKTNVVEVTNEPDPDPFSNVFKMLKEVVDKNAADSMNIADSDNVATIEVVEHLEKASSKKLENHQATQEKINDTVSLEKDEQMKTNEHISTSLDFPSYKNLCGDSNATLKENAIEQMESTNEESQSVNETVNDITQVKIKEEPFNLDYEKAASLYRQTRPIVVYDSTGESSSSSSEDEVPVKKQEVKRIEVEDSDDENNGKKLNDKNLKVMMKERTRTTGEMFPEELPPMEDLAIDKLEDVKLAVLGVVSGIVGVLVIVKSNANTPALHDDTVFFSESKTPLGMVFEVFGTVEKTYYSMRFNKVEDITKKEVKIGDTIMYAPTADNITKYVFLKELQSMKFDDASWENDNEAPPQHREFSDDEKERECKQQKRAKKFRDRPIVEEATQKHARRNNPYSYQNYDNGIIANNDGPKLLQGDLNRNPFGESYSTIAPARQQKNFVRHQQPHHFSPQSSPAGGPRFGQQPYWEQTGNRFQGPPQGPNQWPPQGPPGPQGGAPNQWNRFSGPPQQHHQHNIGHQDMGMPRHNGPPNQHHNNFGPQDMGGPRHTGPPNQPYDNGFGAQDMNGPGHNGHPHQSHEFSGQDMGPRHDGPSNFQGFNSSGPPNSHNMMNQGFRGPSPNNFRPRFAPPRN